MYSFIQVNVTQLLLGVALHNGAMRTIFKNDNKYCLHREEDKNAKKHGDMEVQGGKHWIDAIFYQTSKEYITSLSIQFYPGENYIAGQFFLGHLTLSLIASETKGRKIKFIFKTISLNKSF